MAFATIRDFLPFKRAARAQLVERVRGGATELLTVSARVEVAGASGVRRIRIRDHQVISDSSFDYAGFDLGPTSPELQLGVLGSCLTHTLLIHAAARGVPLDTVTVDVFAELDPRGGLDGFEEVPRQPVNVRYLLHVESPAAAEEVERLVAHVEEVCPVMNLLRAPTVITGELDLITTGATR